MNENMKMVQWLCNWHTLDGSSACTQRPQLLPLSRPIEKGLILDSEKRSKQINQEEIKGINKKVYIYLLSK